MSRTQITFFCTGRILCNPTKYTKFTFPKNYLRKLHINFMLKTSDQDIQYVTTRSYNVHLSCVNVLRNYCPIKPSSHVLGYYPPVMLNSLNCTALYVMLRSWVVLDFLIITIYTHILLWYVCTVVPVAKVKVTEYVHKFQTCTHACAFTLK
jgi:hypothetical protein